MEFSLNALSIRGKLGVILLIPVLGMTFFSIAWLVEKQKLVEEAESLKTLTHLVVVIGENANAFQNERGLTIRYLSKNNDTNLQAVLTQRNITDMQVREFFSLVDKNELGVFDEKFKYAVEDVRYNLRKLNSLRERIDLREFSTLQLINEYQRLNQLLFTLAESIGDVDESGIVAAPTSAYLNIIKIKEYVELERSLLAGLFFSPQEISNEIYNKFVASINNQNNYESLFLSMANDTHRSMYQRSKLSLASKELLKIRKYAREEEERNQIMAELIRNLGFGGYSSYFQAFLFSGASADLEKLEIYYDRINGNLERMRQLLPNSGVQTESLMRISQVINAYHSSTGDIQRYHQMQLPVEDITKNIGLNSSGMSEALDALAEHSRYSAQSANWYDLVTDNINNLRRIEEQVGSDLRSTVDHISQNVRYAVLIFFVSACLIVICSLLLGFLIARNLVQRSTKILNGIQTIASGNLSHSIEVDVDDEFGKIAGSFNRMVATLQEIKSENDKEVWIKTGQSHLNEVMLNETDVEEFAYQVLLFLSNYLGCSYGAFYAPDDHLSLGDHPFYRLRATIGTKASLEEGEGFKKDHSYLGRCVTNRRQIVYEELPQDYVSDGLSDVCGELDGVVHCPLLLMNRVLGVIELGTQDLLIESQLEFLRLIEGSIAISLNMIYDQALLEQILGESRDHAEELARERSLLESSEKLLHGVFEGTADGRIIVSEIGLIEDINVAALNIFGYERDELLSSSVQILVPATLKQEQIQYLEKLDKDKERQAFGHTIEFRGLRKNGEEFPVWLSVSVVTLEGRRIYSAIVRDLVEQKVKEQEVLELVTLLEGERERAKAAIGSQKKFLSNVSHELRTPLNSIIGFSERLKSKLINDISEKHYGALDAINRNGKDLLLTLNNIIDFSTLDAGLVNLDEKEIRLESIAYEVFEMLKAQAERTNVSLKLDIDKQVPGVVLGDENRVMQVLMHMVANAIKFSPDGRVVVSMSFFDESNTDLSIRIDVRDNGIGISQENLQSIFRTFEQVDSSVARKYGGTGLGLSITRNLVRIMGGTITVDSELGTGSNFSVVLPFRKSSAEQRANDNPVPRVS